MEHVAHSGAPSFVSSGLLHDVGRARVKNGRFGYPPLLKRRSAWIIAMKPKSKSKAKSKKPKSDTGPQNQLTYYLFCPSVTKFEQAVDEKKLKGKESFEKITFKKGVSLDGVAYLQRDKSREPWWVGYIRPYCNIDDSNIKNVTNSFLLLLKVKGRIFAVTTGFGFTAVDRDKLELDFGLTVTLNAVDQPRGLQSRKVDANAVHKHIVASRDVGVETFDVDFYQELLARMEGKPRDDGLGTRVEGADSCTLTAAVEFKELDKKCERLLKEYKATTWKKNYPFFEIVRPVRDDKLERELNELLAGAIDGREDGDFSLALPDISTRGAIRQYHLHHPHCGDHYIDDLNAADVFAYLDDRNCANVDVEKFKIVGVDDVGGGAPMTQRLSLFRCAVFQTAHTWQNKTGTYVLTLGKWYEVEKDYVDRVNKRLADRKASLVITTANYLPTIAKNEGETPYNARVCNAPGCSDYVLMDLAKKRPQIEGRSRIEVCDHFANGQDFIHVKRKTESGTLSHLFSQGSVSAECFREHPEYRKFLSDQIVAAGKPALTVGTPNFSDFRVVYAISAPASKTLPDDLPFFSKVNLLHHLASVERMDFKTGLYHVHIV